MNQLQKDSQNKTDSQRTNLASLQLDVCVEKQLSKIYRKKDGQIYCISCQQEILQENVYYHLFDPQHILKLQDCFLEKPINYYIKRERIFQKIDNKNQASVGLQIKKENVGKKEGKQQIFEVSCLNEKLNYFNNDHKLENFIEALQYDLKSIGKIQLSLIVSILVKTYCTITEILEMKFSQILDKSNFYYFNINHSWGKSYQILKQRFPDYLQELITKNAGSNQPLIKLLGQNKRQYLSKQLQLGCQQISKLTNDANYIDFLQGLTFKKLKKLTIERIIKKTSDQQVDQYVNMKARMNQGKLKVQEIQDDEQLKKQEKKQVIKIIIKQSEKQKQSQNEKEEIEN